MKRLVTLISLFLIIFLLSCTQEKNDVAEKCISLCKQQSIDLSNGPCLSNEIEKDWVCDIAHSPRQQVDNLPENQCQSFREGKANRFVEVTPNCELIRKV